MNDEGMKTSRGVKCSGQRYEGRLWSVFFFFFF